jgi:hypothetical protein
LNGIDPQDVLVPSIGYCAAFANAWLDFVNQHSTIIPADRMPASHGGAEATLRQATALRSG